MYHAQADNGLNSADYGLMVDEPAQQPINSIKLTAQNDNPRLVEVISFSLSQGAWDPSAAPSSGQQIEPGNTGCWLAVSTQPEGGVQGMIEFVVAQAGTLQVSWNLQLSQPFQPQLAKLTWNATDVEPSLYTNQGDYAHVWVQLLIVIVTAVRADETLSDIALRCGTTVSILMYLNHLSEDAALTEGQQLLVASRLPEEGGANCAGIVACSEP